MRLAGSLTLLYSDTAGSGESTNTPGICVMNRGNAPTSRGVHFAAMPRFWYQFIGELAMITSAVRACCALSARYLENETLSSWSEYLTLMPGLAFLNASSTGFI